MNNIDIIKQSFKNIKRRYKKNILNFVIIFLIFLMISIMVSFHQTVNKYYDKIINNYPLFRTYTTRYNKELFTHDEIIKLFNETEHIIKVTTQQHFSTLVNIKSDTMNGIINLYGADEATLPEIVYGRGFTSNESNVAICPINFLLGDIDDYSLTKDNFIDGKTLLNKTLKTTFNEYHYEYMKPGATVVNVHDYEFEVVGLFDANKNYVDNNYCFVNYTDVEKINNISDGNKNEVSPIHEEIMIIVIDKMQNTQDIINKFYSINGDEFGISLNPRAEIDWSFISNITLMIYIITIILIIIFVICCLLFMIKNLKDRKNEISLLKTFGYKNKDIYRLYLLEQILVTTISFIVSSIICYIACLIINYLFDNYYLNLSKIDVHFAFGYVFLMFLVFIIVLYLISTIILKQITKINAIEGLKD